MTLARNLVGKAILTAGIGLALAAPTATADPLVDIVHTIAQATNTGSALPPCTPGTVTHIGCQPG
ncbi:hypothetical protein [Nocardia sp. NPDC003979]